MREWLLDLGAARLGVDRGAVIPLNGYVVFATDPTRSVSYGDLAAGRRAQRAVTQDVILKDPATYTIVGQPIPRVGARAKVTGALRYGIDAMADGMLYAKIVRPPALGARLVSIDFSDAEQAPGFVGSFRDGDFAAVVGTRFEWTETALAAVKAQWSVVETGHTSDNIHERLRASADDGSPIPAAPAATSTVPSAVSIASPAAAPVARPLHLTFRDQYVQHAPLEPKACLVNVGPDGVDIWTSTQSPFTVQSAVATQLGVDPAKDETYVAQVARVAVDAATGVIPVERVDCVVDCGLMVNPESVRHLRRGRHSAVRGAIHAGSGAGRIPGILKVLDQDQCAGGGGRRRRRPYGPYRQTSPPETRGNLFRRGPR